MTAYEVVEDPTPMMPYGRRTVADGFATALEAWEWVDDEAARFALSMAARNGGRIRRGVIEVDADRGYVGTADRPPDVICDDGRPEHQYGALMVRLSQAQGHGHPVGWLPAFTPTADEIARLMVEACAWWDEHGRIVGFPS